MGSIPVGIRTLVIMACVFSLAACRGMNPVASSSGLPVTDLPAAAPLQELQDEMPADSKIKHVIVIVQENRSFNNLFYGYPGAKTAKFGYNTLKQKIRILPVVLETTWKVEHDAKGYLEACHGTGKIPGTDCRMNGFNLETVTCGGRGQPRCPIEHPEYSYVPHSETKPYFDMANQYVLADEMFASNFDTSSFVSHQYIIAGQANAAVDYPNGDWGCPGGPTDMVATVSKQRRFPNGYEVPCWNIKTIGGELDKKGLSWAFYATPINQSGSGIWSAYQVIKDVYKGPDWKNDVFTPPSQFLTDIGAGKLRSVTWITPTFPNSDHPGAGSNTGPSWVASLVNAIGESKYWSSSAIFIFWDEYGGLYDPEAPAFVDYDGLGMRLPLLIVSPFAKKGYVSHVHFEHGSILRFIEDQFGLGRLAPSDKRANSPGPDSFDFSQPPRKFVKIAAPYDREYFLHQPPDDRPPDDN
jgi:phospholipase C